MLRDYDSYRYVIAWAISYLILAVIIISVAVWKPIVEHVLFAIALMYFLFIVCNKLADWIFYEDEYDF